MAAIAAQPVFRLLGAKDLGCSDDYKSEKMPAVNVDVLDGDWLGVNMVAGTPTSPTLSISSNGPIDITVDRRLI
jgi:hypothetical protein